MSAASQRPRLPAATNSCISGETKKREKGKIYGPKILVLAPTRELAMQVAKSAQTYGRHVRPTVALAIGDQLRVVLAAGQAGHGEEGGGQRGAEQGGEERGHADECADRHDARAAALEADLAGPREDDEPRRTETDGLSCA